MVPIEWIKLLCYVASGLIAGILLCQWLAKLGVAIGKAGRWFHPLWLGLVMGGWVWLLPVGHFEAVSMILPLYALTILDMRTLTVEPSLVAFSIATRFLWLGYHGKYQGLSQDVLVDGGIANKIADGIVKELAGGRVDQSLLASLNGALLGAGALFLVGFFYRWLRGRTGLGQGDAAVLAAIGAHVGAMGVLWVVLLASSIALLMGPAWLIFNKRPLWESQLPFVPFLCLGGLLTRAYQLAGGISVLG